MLLLRAIPLPCALGDEIRHRHGQRDHQQCHQRQWHVDHEHHDDHTNQAEGAGEELRRTGAQGVADILDIVGEATHQIAMRVLIEEAQRERLEFGEDLIA
ncbi:MAG: hypothetical protein BWY63_03872 [Chloroflexi bacterium ADurb.Bin360]|nr:MAG: hypothetical protein BWY63_03872 [Chloroflexi bacterium ADurb.Bin360]